MPSKDQAVGSGLLASSIIVMAAIVYLLFFSPFALITLKILVTIGVGILAGLIGWIGYTLATTPPPKPIEEIEKEIEEELKKLEQEIKEGEGTEEKSIKSEISSQ